MPAQPSPEGTAEIGPQLQRLGNREIRGPREQDVDVVRHAPNLDGIHSVLPGDAAQEGPESLAQFRCDKRPALLGAENTMEIRANVRHALIQPSLRDSDDSKFAFPTLKTLDYYQHVPSGQRHA